MKWQDYIWCRDFTVQGCRWCRRSLDGRRTAWCSPECTTLFEVNHFWGAAAHEALKRAHYRCSGCGTDCRLEVHHRVPLEGQYRATTCFNHQENLRVLCRACHRALHNMIRQPRAPRPDKWLLKLEAWTKSAKPGP